MCGLSTGLGEPIEEEESWISGIPDLHPEYSGAAPRSRSPGSPSVPGDFESDLLFRYGALGVHLASACICDEMTAEVMPPTPPIEILKS